MELPVEVILKVIDHLYSREIIQLQMTSKHFYRLVKRHGQSIWKRCLQRLCAQSRLFSLTFKELSCADEYKDACLRAVRSRNTHERIAMAGEKFDPDVVQLEFPPRVDQEPRRFDDEIHLVPGGRFLVTAETGGLLSLWDLKCLDSGEKTPALLAQHELGTFGWVAAVAIAPSRGDNPDCLHILTMRAHVEFPAGYQGDLPGDGDDRYRAVNDFTVTTVDYLPGDDTFVMRELGRLSFIGSLNPVSWLDGSRVIIQSSSTLVIWDFMKDRITGWRHSVENPDAILSNEDTTVAISPAGISVFETPKYGAIQDDHCLDELVYSSIHLGPLYSFQHERFSEDADELIPPAYSWPPLHPESLIYYDVVVAQREIEEALYPGIFRRRPIVDRYCFDFRGSSTPSTLTRVERGIIYPTVMRGSYLHTCEDTVWTVYDDDVSVSVSRTDLFQWPRCSAGTEVEGSQPVEALSVRYNAADLGTALDPYSQRAARTGRLVASDIVWVEVFGLDTTRDSSSTSST